MGTQSDEVIKQLYEIKFSSAMPGTLARCLQYDYNYGHLKWAITECAKILLENEEASNDMISKLHLFEDSTDLVERAREIDRDCKALRLGIVAGLKLMNRLRDQQEE